MPYVPFVGGGLPNVAEPSGMELGISVGGVVVTGGANVALSGRQLTISLGSVTVDLVASVSVNVTGVSATVSLGSVTVAGPVLLNHFNGTDGSTTFVDEVAGISWATTGGSPQLDTAIKKFGSASLLLPSISASARASNIPNQSALSYTVEGWVYFAADTVAVVRLCDVETSSRVQFEMSSLDNDVVGLVESDLSGEYVNSGSVAATINTGTWYHWAFTRNQSAQTFSWLFNGSTVISTGTVAENPAILTDIEVTCDGAVHFDDIRVSSGVLYSGATYTIPTAEF